MCNLLCVLLFFTKLGNYFKSEIFFGITIVSSNKLKGKIFVLQVKGDMTNKILPRLITLHIGPITYTLDQHQQLSFYISRGIQVYVKQVIFSEVYNLGCIKRNKYYKC